MKKCLALMLVAVLLLVNVVCAAAEPVLISPETYKSIREADRVFWVGGKSVLLKSEAEGVLIDLRNGKILLTGVEKISRCGNETAAFIQDEIWLVNEECTLELLPFRTAESVPAQYEAFADGWIVGIDDTHYFFWNEKTRCGLTKQQQADAKIESCETWTDPATGKSVLLLAGNGVSEVYGESGDLLNRLEWASDGPVYNGHFNRITNGRLMGCRKQDNRAVIRDLYTGEDIKVFEPGWYWRYYDGQCQIFEDGTAIIDCYEEGTYYMTEYAIVDLDGRELIHAENFIWDRFASEFYKVSGQSDTYYWDQNTCEIYKVVETYSDDELISAEKIRVKPGEEIPGIVYAPEIADGTAAGKYTIPYQGISFDWQESDIAIYSQDGTLLDGQTWSEIWYMGDGGDGVDYNSAQVFVKNGYLPVMNKENKWGVLATDGHMILPLEYDRLENSDSRYTHIGFVARKGNEVMIYDINGQPVFRISE